MEFKENLEAGMTVREAEEQAGMSKHAGRQIIQRGRRKPDSVWAQFADAYVAGLSETPDDAA